MGLVIHVDGGSRGNPGPAGAGVVIQRDGGERVYEAGFFLGTATNNEAEYHAVLRALQVLTREPAAPVAFHSDSELLVRQITGQYQVKAANLQELFGQVQRQLLKRPAWQFRHVRRELNRRADELANMAMDRRADTIVFDEAGGDTAPPPAADPAKPSMPPPPAPAPAPVRETAPTTANAEADGKSRCVRVNVARPADARACPAGGAGFETMQVRERLGTGCCLHAAHALLPTILAIQNTAPGEFALIPTLTIRCGRAGCGAEFQAGPDVPKNGAPH